MGIITGSGTRFHQEVLGQVGVVVIKGVIVIQYGKWRKESFGPSCQLPARDRMGARQKQAQHEMEREKAFHIIIDVYIVTLIMYFGYSVNFICLNIDSVICGNKPKDGSQMGLQALFP